MNMDSARQRVAQCWCDPRVSDRTMDPELAEVLAEMLVAELKTPIDPEPTCEHDWTIAAIPICLKCHSVDKTQLQDRKRNDSPQRSA